MTVVTFREDLYSGFAIDQATKVYGKVAQFDLARESGVYKVSITATGNFDETRIALEFQNYALGATIERLKFEGTADRAGSEQG